LNVEAEHATGAGQATADQTQRDNRHAPSWVFAVIDNYVFIALRHVPKGIVDGL
jgi:hypothetical protein